MSVRMALAKLCACTCGGAVIGAGAAHVAEHPRPRPALVTHHAREYARAKTVRRVRRVGRTACIVRQPERTVTTRTYAYAPPPPLPPVEVASAPPPPIIVGGSSGGGGFGGGFFSGGFFGGSSGNVIFNASTSSTGGSSSSSASSSSS